MVTAIDVLHTVGWYPESAASLSKLKISLCRMLQAHFHAHLVRPEMPGTFIWAAVKIGSLASLLVMGVYSMSSGLGVRLIGGSAGRLGGSGVSRITGVELHQNPSYKCINRGLAKWALATLELIHAMRVVIVEDEPR